MNDFDSTSSENGQVEASESQSLTDTQSLERIKQILFGDSLSYVLNQIQDMDARLNQRLLNLESRFDQQIDHLHKRVTADVQSLRQELTDSINHLDQRHQTRAQELEAHIQHSKSELLASLEAQDHRQQEQNQALQSSFQTLAEEAANRDQRFRDSHEQIHVALNDRAHEWQQQLSSHFDELTQGIQTVRETHDSFKVRLSESLTHLSQNL